MTSFDLVIRGGTLVSPEMTKELDIGVEGDSIKALGLPGSLPEGLEEINAEGKYVIPGLVDAHVHCFHKIKGGPDRTDDDFNACTISAAAGGVTMHAV